MPRTTLALFLLTSLVLAGCTSNESPVEDDADGDLLSDVNESTPRIIEIVLVDGPVRREVTSDPAKADSDDDGLSDLDEVQRGTDPKDPDTDDDGLLDGDDRTPQDEALTEAWRRQGIYDVNGTFLGELDACPADGPQLKATHASSDLPVADRLLDGEELRGWTVMVRANAYHVTSDPCTPDTDGDGMPDHDEKQAGSDPRQADTDRDGVTDWGDVDPTADVYLRFDELEGAPANASRGFRLLFATATTTASLVSPGNGSALLNVPDGRGSEANSTKVGLTMMVTDASGEPLNMTGHQGGATLFVDLVQRTVEGAQSEGDRLAFTGPDGSLSFRWSIERR